jgi:hypothetical protein
MTVTLAEQPYDVSIADRSVARDSTPKNHCQSHRIGQEWFLTVAISMQTITLMMNGRGQDAVRRRRKVDHVNDGVSCR